MQEVKLLLSVQVKQLGSGRAGLGTYAVGTQGQTFKHSSTMLLKKMWKRDREQRKGHFKANHWPQALHGPCSCD